MIWVFWLTLIRADVLEMDTKHMPYNCRTFTTSCLALARAAYASIAARRPASEFAAPQIKFSITHLSCLARTYPAIVPDKT